jgi:hypothetical protein
MLPVLVGRGAPAKAKVFRLNFKKDLPTPTGRRASLRLLEWVFGAGGGK